ncbi:hypothetical protein BDR26DRAFT_858268 [Obelidium mucronatum]|nr:hypothetical protein BDR26DRAFT_858268 [Obelidium mucronatum]
MWLQPVSGPNMLISIKINSDGTANMNPPILLAPAPQPRTQSSSASILTNFNHTIMLVYGGYTTSSTATSLSLSPLSGSNSVFAFDMTNQTIASSYIVQFRPSTADITRATFDLTIPQPMPSPTLTWNSTLQISPTTTTTQTATASPTIVEDAPPRVYPTLPPSYFSNIQDPIVMGPCFTDPINCLNFAFVGVQGGAYYYGGGQSNTSTTNQFWFLNTSVDGMWHWTNLNSVNKNAKPMPAWWNVKGFSVAPDVLNFVLPFEDVAKTGGLIKYYLNNSTFDFLVSQQPNITDYYVQQPSQPQGVPFGTPTAIGLGLGVALVLATAISVVYYRRNQNARRRRRRQEPYSTVESHTPEPGGPVISPLLAPRRSMFKMSTERGTSSTPLPKEPRPSLEFDTSINAVEGAGGGGGSSSTLTDGIAMSTFNVTSSPVALPPPRNRIIASWRVLTGAHPIVTPSSGPAARSISGGNGRGPPSIESDGSIHNSSDVGNLVLGGSLNSHSSGGGGGVVVVVDMFLLSSTSSSNNSSSSSSMRHQEQALETLAFSDLLREPKDTMTCREGLQVAGPDDGATATGPPPTTTTTTPTNDVDGIEIVSANVVIPSPTTVENGTQQQPDKSLQAIVISPHNPIGKDEIELRINDHISLTPDPSDNPHSSFVRGLNLNSGRTGLFPRHFVVAGLGTVPGGGLAVRNNGAVVVVGGDGGADGIGGTISNSEKSGGGSDGGVGVGVENSALQSPPAPVPSQLVSSIVAPLVPPIRPPPQQQQQQQANTRGVVVSSGIVGPRQAVVGGGGVVAAAATAVAAAVDELPSAEL